MSLLNPSNEEIEEYRLTERWKSASTIIQQKIWAKANPKESLFKGIILILAIVIPFVVMLNGVPFTPFNIFASICLIPVFWLMSLPFWLIPFIVIYVLYEVIKSYKAYNKLVDTEEEPKITKVNPKRTALAWILILGGFAFLIINPIAYIFYTFGILFMLFISWYIRKAISAKYRSI